MTGQQRRGPAPKSEVVEAPASEEVAGAGLSNAAFAEQLGAAADPGALVDAGEVTGDVARDLAIAAVERARLALEVAPQPEALVARFVEILEGSRLPADQRDRLIDKIRTDDAAARGLADAVAREFPGGERAAIGAVLDAVAAALVGGQADGSAWVGGDVRVELAGRDAADAASTLVAALAEGPGREALGDGAGDRIARFCQHVAVWWLWDEEEEEGLEGSVDAELI